MPSNRPDVSVIVPHLNQPEYLDVCLASLERQTLPSRLYEVIVVDNGSSQTPEQVISKYPRARLLIEPTPGPGPARNTGVDHAIGGIIAFIDADCRAHDEWLRTAFERLTATPAKSLLGGDVRIWHENESLTAIEAYESVFAYLFKQYIEHRGFSGTGNLVVRRDDFYKIGQFAGIGIAEDMDWGQRACAAGYRFAYVPEMIVFHPARRTFKELCIKWDRHLYHYANMAQGRPLWRARWIARALVVLVSPIIDQFKVFRSDRIHGLGNRMKALGVLVRIRTYRAWRMLSFLRAQREILWNRNQVGHHGSPHRAGHALDPFDPKVP